MIFATSAFNPQNNSNVFPNAGRLVSSIIKNQAANYATQTAAVESAIIGSSGSLKEDAREFNEMLKRLYVEIRGVFFVAKKKGLARQHLPIENENLVATNKRIAQLPGEIVNANEKLAQINDRIREYEANLNEQTAIIADIELPRENRDAAATQKRQLIAQITKTKEAQTKTQNEITRMRKELTQQKKNKSKLQQYGGAPMDTPGAPDPNSDFTEYDYAGNSDINEESPLPGIAPRYGSSNSQYSSKDEYFFYKALNSINNQFFDASKLFEDAILPYVDDLSFKESKAMQLGIEKIISALTVLYNKKLQSTKDVTAASYLAYNVGHLVPDEDNDRSLNELMNDIEHNATQLIFLVLSAFKIEGAQEEANSVFKQFNEAKHQLQYGGSGQRLIGLARKMGGGPAASRGVFPTITSDIHHAIPNGTYKFPVDPKYVFNINPAKHPLPLQYDLNGLQPAPYIFHILPPQHTL